MSKLWQRFSTIILEAATWQHFQTTITTTAQTRTTNRTTKTATTVTTSKHAAASYWKMDAVRCIRLTNDGKD